MGCGICKGQNLGDFIVPPASRVQHPSEICQENLDTLGRGEQAVVIQTKLPAGQEDSVESQQRPIDTYGKLLGREVRRCEGGY